MGPHTIFDFMSMFYTFVLAEDPTSSKVMSGWSVNLATLFLGRLRPPQWLTSTSCTNFGLKTGVFFPCHNKDVDHSCKIMVLNVCSCFIAEFNTTDLHIFYIFGRVTSCLIIEKLQHFDPIALRTTKTR